MPVSIPEEPVAEDIKPDKDEVLEPFYKFFRDGKSVDETSSDSEDVDEEGYNEDDDKKVFVEYYDPQPGDFVVGVVVSGNEYKLDVNIGADMLGTMLTKEVLPLYEKELDYLLCDFQENGDEFMMNGKMGVVRNDEALSGEPVAGQPVVDHGTVLFAEVLGRTLSGRPLISTRRLFRRLAWHRVRQIKQFNEPIEVKITEWNTGGLITRIEGLRGFLPKAELVNRVTNFTELKENVGRRLYVQITRISEDTNDLILSEKEAWNAIHLKEGTLLDGTVRKLFPYGAQIRIGETNRSGLLHISNISRGEIVSVSDVLALDEKVKVLVVKSMFPDKISLSTAELESEPGMFLSNKEKVFSEAAEMAKKYKQKLPAISATRKLEHLSSDALPFNDEERIVLGKTDVTNQIDTLTACNNPTYRRFLVSSPSTTMAVSPSTTTAAIEALLKWHKTNTKTDTTLNPDEDFIYLVLTLKNIPQKAPPNGSHFGIRSTPYKIPLPNAIISSPEVCLIIDDRPNSNLTSKQAKEKIASDGVPVSKVIKLSKLKSSYKPFEAKRKLCDSYDMFFADKRVVPLLPKLLGKHFFRSKKLPLGVDLCHKNWKEQIERGFKAGLLSFGTGTCSVVRVARVGMEKGEIVENVNAGVEGVLSFVPKKILGVRSLHLKFSGSVALPLYQSLPDIKLRIDGKDGESVEDVMEIDGAGSDKKGKKKAKRGRIHDVDHDEIDGLDGGELDVDESVGKVAKKDGSDKKKRKGNVGDEKKKAKKGKVEVEKDEPGSAEVVNVKAEKKSGKDKKRKENVVVAEEKDTKPSDKKAKKKGEKKVSGDSGKKEKKKGRKIHYEHIHNWRML
uniref:Nucleic acid-binding, OB-fold n=1 Tax=Tanacetum cinerariifolium TaxID=118510 RepID=A0A6L2J8R6_TANCI|nr:nucleic acid-binding, OB-fold [Tanacetum cinerariifolium]